MGRDARRRRLGLGFDLDGRPLAESSDQVNQRIDHAFDDPDTRVVLAILRHQHTGDLHISIMGPPSQETLELLEHSARTYRRILYGPES